MKNYIHRNIMIRDISVYFPENSIATKEIVDEFKEAGKDIEIEVNEFLGKKHLRKIACNEENTLTMSITAAKNVLNQAKLTGQDMDMIVLSSAIPEYLTPPTSILINRAINGKPEALCYDINVACCGMTTAMLQIYRQMEADSRIQRVLLIGAEYLTIHLQQYDEIMKPNVGDCACAVIIEKTDQQSRLIDSLSYLDLSCAEELLFPACGMSNIYHREEQSRRFRTQNPFINEDIVVTNIQKLLSDNHLSCRDIALFCSSQFSLFNLKSIRKKLELSEERCPYVSSDIGYTSTVSPFLVLWKVIQQKKIHRGDYVLFWTVGAGIEYIFVLIQY